MRYPGIPCALHENAGPGPSTVSGRRGAPCCRRLRLSSHHGWWPSAASIRAPSRRYAPFMVQRSDRGSGPNGRSVAPVISVRVNQDRRWFLRFVRPLDRWRQPCTAWLLPVGLRARCWRPGYRSGSHLVRRDYLPLGGGAAPPRPRSSSSLRRIGRTVLTEGGVLVYLRVNEDTDSPGCSGPQWRLAHSQPEVADGSAGGDALPDQPPSVERLRAARLRADLRGRAAGVGCDLLGSPISPRPRAPGSRSWSPAASSSSRSRSCLLSGAPLACLMPASCPSAPAGRVSRDNPEITRAGDGTGRSGPQG